MSLIKTSQVIHINSKKRINGFDHDFTYNVGLKKGNTFTHMAAMSVSIPKSYYLIGQGENTFDIIERDINTEQITAQYTITIPIGNYSITSFLLVLNQLFQSTAPHYNSTFPDSSTEAQTGKITFTHNNTHHYSEFVFGNNHLPEVMGFNRNSTNRFTINQNNSTLVSFGVCNFQKEQTLFLHCSACQNETDDILLELFASGNPQFSHINFENQGNLEEHSKILNAGVSSSNIFRFYLTDEFDSIINLNNINLLITLIFYEKDNTYHIVRGFIKYKMLIDEENEKKN
jgi:hypothetical protein